VKNRFKLKVIAAVAAAAVITLPGLARADAIAQSILDISSFSFKIGDGALGGGTSLSSTTGISVSNVKNTADALAILNGVTATTTGADVGATPNRIACAGAGCPAVYVPGAKLLQPGGPTATYVGSNGALSGNALLGTAHALTDNTVSLFPTGVGSSQSNVNLNAVFSLNVSAAGQKLQTSFDAFAFLRNNIDATGLASSSYSWTMVLSDVNGIVFQWTPTSAGSNIPDGGGISEGNGIQYAAAFNLNRAQSDLTPGPTMSAPLQFNPASGYFEAETGDLAMGDYTLAISQLGRADASVVPEPGSLAMLGTGLLVAALSTRRRKPKA